VPGTTTDAGGVVEGETAVEGVPAEAVDEAAELPGDASGLEEFSPPQGAEAADTQGEETPPEDPQAAEPPSTEEPPATPPEQDGGEESPRGEDDQPPSPEGADPNAPEQPQPPTLEPGQSEPGQPLAIPEEALKSGSTRFLNGRWSSSTTLMDSDTGRPIELEYEFKEGAGSVSLKRDGVVCKGATNASMENGQLVISDTGDIRCPDGTRYRGSRVECSVDDRGLADCAGRYPTGDSFSTRIKKSE
jgi:hypothetical protein